LLAETARTGQSLQPRTTTLAPSEDVRPLGGALAVIADRWRFRPIPSFVKIRLLCCLAASVVLVLAASEARAGAITKQGESPARANIPTADDPRAAGGSLLSLTSNRRPPRRGWRATYAVWAPAPGVYRLEAVVSSPWESSQGRLGSQFGVSVNGGRPFDASMSDLGWGDFRRAWGDLFKARLDDVVLRRGANAITFRVSRRAAAPRRFFLDELTLTPRPLALTDIQVVGPASKLDVYRGRAALRFLLNGHAARAETVRYTIADYSAAAISSGEVTIAAGAARAGVPLPDLPPGHFTVRATLVSAPRASVVGYIARLPDRKPVSGPASRFGVNAATLSLVPWTRLEDFAAVVKWMGAGHVREYTSIDHVTRTLHARGLETIEVLEHPWRVTRASVPLPADLREAYAVANRLARKPRAARPDALQISNEPDVDTTSSTGDQHAAFAKAAALGVTDAPHPPLIALPGIASEGPFQRLMLRNDVAR
jgi:hypothetical protein